MLSPVRQLLKKALSVALWVPPESGPCKFRGEQRNSGMCGCGEGDGQRNKQPPQHAQPEGNLTKPLDDSQQLR